MQTSRWHSALFRTFNKLELWNHWATWQPPAKGAYHHRNSLLFLYDFMLHRDLAKTLTVTISQTILFMAFYWINTYDYLESFHQIFFSWVFTKDKPMLVVMIIKHTSLTFILIKSLECWQNKLCHALMTGIRETLSLITSTWLCVCVQSKQWMTCIGTASVYSS